jgi:tripartite-type tricarboxylate transporter receptor subunit TctC
MKRTWLLVVMVCILAGVISAQDAATFYKGKTVTVVIPSSPGGTFDLISRVVGPYIEKYAGVTLLMQNSKNIQAQNIIAKAKPDGLTIVLAGHGPKEITAQLFKQEGVAFDWTKFVLLARIPSSSTAFSVDRKLGIKTVADLQGKAFITGGSSPFFEPLFAEALGFDKMSFVPGISGGDRTLFMRRGEIQACVGGAAQMNQDADLMLPLVVSTADPKGFPGIKTAEELALKGKEKWGRLVGAWDALMYWSYAAPGTPADRAAFLEDALKKTYDDPAFRADLAKLKIDLSDHFIGSAELKALTKEIESLSDAEIAEMKAVIETKYLKKL